MRNRPCPVALFFPAHCGKELPGPTHGGGEEGAEVFFICVYIYFFSSELSTRRFLPKKNK